MKPKIKYSNKKYVRKERNQKEPSLYVTKARKRREKKT